MNAQRKPYGYSYRKTDRRQQPEEASVEGANATRFRFRLFGMHWRVLPLYRQAGSPFGESDSGLLLWLEFGRRSYSN